MSKCKKYSLKTHSFEELPKDEYGIINWSQVEIPRINFKSLDAINFVKP